MIAVCTIRKEPHYRREAFELGLQRAGYTLAVSGPPRGVDDLLVIWNRQNGDEAVADQWERAGGTVVVCENGYAGKDAGGRQLYAVAIGGHNGSGRIPVGVEPRFDDLDIELRPWQDNPRGHILVCGQRGIGSREMASPRQWDDETVRRLKAMGQKSIRLRRHPGRYAPQVSLEQDLRGARLCVIWSSSAGIKALQLGIPVIYCAPHWICEGAAAYGLRHVENPVCSDALRRDAMDRMAHAQRTVEEIQTGEVFVKIRDLVRGASC